jgi:hypothetical protein
MHANHFGQQSRVRALTKKGSQQIYNTIPKCKEWLIVNYVVNATKGFLPRVFIFKGEIIIDDDYIKNCKSRT